MRHKKHKLLHKVHSIPIINNLCKEKRLYLVSYSILLSCMVVLLLGGVMFANPDLFINEKSYAVEVGDNSLGDISANPNSSFDSNSDNSDDDSINDSLGDSADDGFGGYGDTDFSVSDEDAEAGIMPLANVNPSLGLSVTNSDKVIETVQGGPTAYSDHLVTITGAEVTNYTLSMSTSSTNLTKPSGSNSSGSSGTSGADITGANGATGDSMPANRWGYSVVEESTSNSSYGGLKYATMPTTSTTIASGNASSDNTLNVKKKLVIAAKFGEDAAPGNYRQQINLSAVANANTVTFKITYDSNGGGTAPAVQTKNDTANSVSFTLPDQGDMSKDGYIFKGWSTSSSASTGSAAGSSYTVSRTNPNVTLYAVWKVQPVGTWSNDVNSGVTTMQDIKSGFCASSIPVGSTITLKDSRQNSVNSYKIVKLKDNKCWMQENLKLGGSSTLTLTPSDSAATSNYTLPASNDGAWSTTDPTEGRIRVGKTASNMSGYQSSYGNYYSWCAATAGTCSETTSSNVNVSGSICPKNWHLPSGGPSSSTDTNVGQNSEFYKLFGDRGSDLGSSYADKFSVVQASPYLFLAAGFIGNGGSLSSAGSFGLYWSSTAGSSTYANAYRLIFYFSGFASGTDFDNRYNGYSVRCIADY